MNRIRKMDALLLAALSGAWFLCFVLHVNQLVRGGFAWIPIYVDPAPAPDAHPSLAAFWPGAESHAPALAPGDRLQSVGGRDLTGAGRLDVIDALYDEPAGQPISVVAVRGDRRIEGSLSLQPIPHPWRKTLVAASFALLGTLAFWRTRGSATGRAFYFAMLAYAFHWTDFFGGTTATTNTAIAVFGLATALTAPLALRVTQVFPEELAASDRYSRRWPWAFLVMGPVFTSWAFGLPFPVPGAGSLAMGLTALYVALLVGRLTRNYRASGPRGRRQLKWVVLGFWIGLVPSFLTAMLALAAPELWWLYEASLLLTVAIPICLFIALVRFDLFDINHLLTAATTYSVIGVGVLAAVFLVVPRVSLAAADWVEPEVSQPAIALALAGFVLFGLRHFDELLQARLYPERRALESEAGRLRDALSSCEKPADVLTALGIRLRALLALESVAIYARTRSTFAPVFARGPAVCPSFAVDGELASEMEVSRDPVDPGRGGRADADWAALTSMGVELVIPISVRDELAAFLCLGGKASGDIFTSSDVALLLALADKAATELLRFEQDEVQRQARELHDQLRRYVPPAVVRELDEGLRLDPGERDVSILFVDIRGFTAFSERQRPDTIFQAVGRYTNLVSRVVEECGGSVVEFHGDGLMAVFGAPRPLEHKEQCAVRAARRIAESVPELDVSVDDEVSYRLQVGVGVATGLAYVGPLTTAERTIWAALGNTTNLAARLEKSTRELAVSIVVDAPTHEAAGSIAESFVAKPALRVKGRSQPLDVFTWTHAALEVGS